MTPQILTCEQGSPEWFAARAGIPTASEFGTVMRTKGKGDDGTSVTRRKYMLRLAGERITGSSEDTYTNTHMERGKEMEAEARSCYTFMRDAEPELVGFIRNGDAGCSPDSLIGVDGGLEIKTALPHILIDKILRGDFPPEHKAQTQGFLWIAEREWVDIAIYWPKLPLFVKRAHRDAAYIANLARAIAAFNEELAAVVETVGRYSGDPSSDLKSALEASVAAGMRDKSGRPMTILEAG
jgi:hypothetical protein